jgi:hypothetical protein
MDNVSEFILTELEKQLQKKFNLSEKEAKEFLMCFALKNFVYFLKNPRQCLVVLVNKSLPIISTEFDPVLSCLIIVNY